MSVCDGGYSRGYGRHLFEAHEIMGVTLVAAHNLFDYLGWLGRLKGAVRNGEFTVAGFVQAGAAGLLVEDQINPKR